MSRIDCHLCGKEIRSRSDLVVVARWGIFVCPYCADCHANREKGYRHHTRMGTVPVNSSRTTWGLITSFAVWLVLVALIQGSVSWWLLVVLGVAYGWATGMRAYSYFRYERNLA